MPLGRKLLSQTVASAVSLTTLFLCGYSADPTVVANATALAINLGTTPLMEAIVSACHKLRGSWLENPSLRNSLKRAFDKALKELERQYRSAYCPNPTHLDDRIIADAIEALTKGFEFILGSDTPDEQIGKIIFQGNAVFDSVFQTKLQGLLEDIEEPLFGFILSKFTNQLAQSFTKELQQDDTAWKAAQVLTERELAQNVQGIATQLQSVAGMGDQLKIIHELLVELRGWNEELAKSASERNPIGQEALDDAVHRITTVMAAHASGVQQTVRTESNRVVAAVGEVRALIEARTFITDSALTERAAPTLFGTRAIPRDLLRSIPAARIVDITQYRPANNERLRQYYEGSPLSWDIIAANGDITRDVLPDLVQRLSNSYGETRLICLVGESGSGKTTLAWRAAVEASKLVQQPLLQVRDNEAAELWYSLEVVVEEHGEPLLILVDDVFKNEDVRRAMKSLRSDLPMTILATSPLSEVGLDRRWPYRVEYITLAEPTPEEKRRLLERLSFWEYALDHKVRERLRQANAWWVMMVEATTGLALSEIIRDSLSRLEQQDEIVYRAYEYLCFAGQYNVSIPKSLLYRLDSRGRFHDITNRPASAGFIFSSQSSEGSASPKHPRFAAEAMKVYNRDPRTVANEIINKIDVGEQLERTFLGNLLHRLASSQEAKLARSLIQKHEVLIPQMIQASHVAELANTWAGLYKALDNRSRAREIELQALELSPEASSDWIASFKLAERYENDEQIQARIDGVINWLAQSHGNQFPQPTQFFKYIERWASREQLGSILEITDSWLQSHPEEQEIRVEFIHLIERQGTAKQLAEALNVMRTWLGQNQSNEYVRVKYMSLIERHHTDDLGELIDSIGSWLEIFPTSNNVRAEYLRLVSRYGDPKRIARALDGTASWLSSNFVHRSVCFYFLELLTVAGTSEQVEEMLSLDTPALLSYLESDHTRRSFINLLTVQASETQKLAVAHKLATRLKYEPHEFATRMTYLQILLAVKDTDSLTGLIDEAIRQFTDNLRHPDIQRAFFKVLVEHATSEQCSTLMANTSAWLQSNPEDNSIRAADIELALNFGTSKEKAVVVQETLPILASKKMDTRLLVAYLHLVQHHGMPDEVNMVRDYTVNWLTEDPTVAPVYFAYIDLVEGGGDITQIFDAIERTSKWLLSNSDDTDVRRRHFDLVLQYGSDGHIDQLLRSTANWLRARPYEASLRMRYLNLLSERASQQQLLMALPEIIEWIPGTPKNPSSVVRWLRFVSKWVVDGKLQGEAIDVFRIAAKIHRTVASVWRLWADVEKQLGNFEEAFRLYSKVISIEPSNKHAQLALGLDGKSSGLLGAMRRTMKLRIAQDDLDIASRYQWAMLEYRLGSPDLTQLQKAVSKDKAIYHDFKRWIDASRNQGNVAEVRKLYQRATARYPAALQILRAWITLEWEASKAGNSSEDVLTQELREVELRYSKVLEGWGIFEKENGNYQAARDHFAEAVSLEYNLGRSYQPWAIMERELGHLDLARSLFRKSADADYYNTATWQAWSMLELDAGAPLRALELAELAVRTDRRSAYAYMARGRCHRALGNTEQAMRDFSQAKDLLMHEFRKQKYGAKTRLRNLIGRVLIDLGRYEEAESILQESLVRSSPSQIHYALNGLGELYAAQGLSDRAREQWRLAIEHSPHYLVAKNNLDRVLGDRDSGDAS